MTPESSFKPLQPGDVVRLKSGGPWMTVERRIRSSAVQETIGCSWFVAGDCLSNSFAEEALISRDVFDRLEAELVKRRAELLAERRAERSTRGL